MKEEGLAERLAFDRVKRSSLRERFLPASADLDGLIAASCTELGDFFDNAFTHEVEDRGLRLARRGKVADVPINLSKYFSFDDKGGFSVTYDLTGAQDAAFAGVQMGVEFNICLPGCAGPACYLELASGGARHGLGVKGVDEGVSKIIIVDEYSKMKVVFELSRNATLWRYPIETISLSEAGFERNYQGSSLVFLVPLEELLGDGDKLTITMKIESI
jgi:hypothetical protein